ncbi:exosortase-dependent surface protein XDP1 [Thalassotalea atypica]|uniref:exosortase-dependent surface protein XDP1 n=1 Tax=Thalassotalea atypica TaxID=2054316 RepID=UPI0025735799|nr:exosortase-dependent surface protein XDP1 [Thalassotalea atypica]
MFVSPKKWIIAGLVMLPLQAMAGTTTASFGTINVDGTTYSSGEPGSNFNQFSVDAGGITVNVSGWSNIDNGSGYDIRRATDFDRNGNGWSLQNQYEGGGSPEHSADNTPDGSYLDYDFYVLDFGAQEVELENVYSSWLWNENDTQVSIAALDKNEVPSDLTGETFSSLLSTPNASSGSSDFSSSRMSINYDNDSSRNNYYADVNVNASSSLWVVSAYHTMFGSVGGATANNDGFKFAGISFTTSPGGGGGGSTIPEPSTMAILALALFGLSAKRRKS